MRSITRRRFIKSSGALAGALVVGFHLSLPPRRAGAFAAESAPGGAKRSVPPNAFLRLARDGTCTVVVKHTELGQGSTTALPMLVAEELECEWSKVRFELAPAHADYVHTQWGIMATGGSTGVSDSWEQLRVVGAQVRTMLLAAAAEQWKVKPSEVRAEKGHAIGPGGKKLAYGALAEAAARQPVPAKVELKPVSALSLVGKPTRRLDSLDKITGKTVFGSDMRLKDLHVAVVARPPVFGARPASFKADALKSIPGITHVVELSSGVAVVARGFWAARRGCQALDIQWELAPRSRVDSVELAKQFRETAKTPGKVARKAADPAAIGSSAKRVAAEYEVPYLAHACMEPLNCTVELRGTSAEIWVGSQGQTTDHESAARVLGLDPANVKLNTLPAGGGFGRRNNPDTDVVAEACEIARQVKVPVKLLYTREDDMRAGWYRPMMVHRVEAGLDAAGAITGWKHVVVGSPITGGAPPEALARMTFDPAAIEGVRDSPYDLPNLEISSHPIETMVPVLWWRSVGYSHGVFALESMLDEIAAAAGKDPLELRRGLLGKSPRALRVLELAASKAGWSSPAPAGRARGLALSALRGSFCAHVAEVSLQAGKPRVHRIVAALDCGVVVNPLGAQAQVQGAVAFGLSAALHGRITLRDGRVEQSNFHDYPIVRMSGMPNVEVHFAGAGEPPTGLGETGVPAVAPAVGNALFALTGKRARVLPFDDTNWT